MEQLPALAKRGPNADRAEGMLMALPLQWNKMQEVPLLLDNVVLDTATLLPQVAQQVILTKGSRYPKALVNSEQSCWPRCPLHPFSSPAESKYETTSNSGAHQEKT